MPEGFDISFMEGDLPKTIAVKKTVFAQRRESHGKPTKSYSDCQKWHDFGVKFQMFKLQTEFYFGKFWLL